MYVNISYIFKETEENLGMYSFEDECLKFNSDCEMEVHIENTIDKLKKLYGDIDYVEINKASEKEYLRLLEAKLKNKICLFYLNNTGKKQNLKDSFSSQCNDELLINAYELMIEILNKDGSTS